MRLTVLQILTRDVQSQREWIAQCGGDLSGYVAKYGSANDPKHYGNGGEAIYAADVAFLKGLEQALEASRRAMTVGDRVGHISPKTVDRMVVLVALLNEHVIGGASEISFSALLGDDGVWTLRQEIQNLFNLTQAVPSKVVV